MLVKTEINYKLLKYTNSKNKTNTEFIKKSSELLFVKAEKKSISISLNFFFAVNTCFNIIFQNY